MEIKSNIPFWVIILILTWFLTANSEIIDSEIYNIDFMVNIPYDHSFVQSSDDLQWNKDQNGNWYYDDKSYFQDDASNYERYCQWKFFQNRIKETVELSKFFKRIDANFDPIVFEDCEGKIPVSAFRCDPNYHEPKYMSEKILDRRRATLYGLYYTIPSLLISFKKDEHKPEKFLDSAIKIYQNMVLHIFQQGKICFGPVF